MVNKHHKGKRRTNSDRIGSNRSHQMVDVGTEATTSRPSRTLWWQSALELEECPITLDSFATLPYPPFSLSGDDNGRRIGDGDGSETGCSYFDGFALASYLVARGIFQNPLTRQDLTMEDCRRLDGYLELHQERRKMSSASASAGQGSRFASVAEAFSLQRSIQVETASSSGSTQRGREEARAQVLRRTATAALAGLFEYRRPNQRGRSGPRGRTSEEEEEEVPQDPRLTEWGFDLSRTVEGRSSQNDYGWTVIDDDENLATAAQRDAYEFVQDSFPRLDENSDRIDDDGTNNDHNYDESLIQNIRSVAFQEEQQNQRHNEALALAQQRLRTMALQGQQERKQEQQEQWQQNRLQLQQEQREKEQLMRAREEIDAWGERHWETLRQLSEEQVGMTKNAKESTESGCFIRAQNFEPEVKAREREDTTAEEAANNKKAKAAAKRKRAKARKKAQKAAAGAAQVQKRKEEELAAEKAASAERCAACGGGMLDAGFEKFGLKFCSTKCARSAQPTDR